MSVFPKTRRSARWFDLALLFLLAVIWGSSFLVIKVAVETIPPTLLTASRLVIAALVLTTIIYLTKQSLPRRLHDWVACLFVGFFGNVLPFSLIHWGETHVDSGLAAILMGTMPIVVTLLAHLFIQDERLNIKRLSGVTVGFSGLVILVGWHNLSHLGDALLSQLAIVGGACCYAITTIYVRRYVSASNLSMAAGSMVTGALMALVLSGMSLPPPPYPIASASVLAALFLGLISTALATLIYFRLLSRIAATTFAQVNNLVPAIGALLGIIFLNEHLSGQQLLALLLILSGIYIINHAHR